jgi:hypothetical protein
MASLNAGLLHLHPQALWWRRRTEWCHHVWPQYSRISFFHWYARLLFLSFFTLPFNTVFIGIGIEILLEAPTQQARLGQPMTGATISDSWMFCIVHELAHQCYALGLQIRQLLEKVTMPCHYGGKRCYVSFL